MFHNPSQISLGDGSNQPKINNNKTQGGMLLISTEAADMACSACVSLPISVASTLLSPTLPTTTPV